MTTEEMQARMGNETTSAEADAMLRLLKKRNLTVDQLTDEQFFKLIPEAVRSIERAELEEAVREAESLVAWSQGDSTDAEKLLAKARKELEDHLHPTCLLTECEINVFITSKMRDEQPELTQELFDDVELALHTCHTIARNIREKYPFMRVEVRP